MKIIAMDPGGNTGLVIGDYDIWSGKSAHEVVSSGLIEVMDINCRDVFAGFRDIDRVVCGNSPDVVLIEGFHLWTAAADLTPVQLLALSEWEWGVKGSLQFKYAVQQPHERSVVRDDQLRRWSLWHPGRKDVNAAMKHLIVYVRKLQASPGEGPEFDG